jgi:hypothetical protein
METIIPYAAICLSFISLLGTYWFNRRLLGARSMSHLAHLIQLERSVADIPSVFRFHAISEEQIAEAGITPQELAYLVASTTAGGVYHRTHSPGVETPFNEGSYRHTMCATIEFQKAWPLVKLMMNESEFTKRLDLTIEKITTT